MAYDEEVCGEVQSRGREDGEHDLRGAMEVGRDCVCDVGVGLVHVTLSGVWGQLEDRDVGQAVYAGPSRLINNTAARIKAMGILERESIVLMPQQTYFQISSYVFSIIGPFNIVKLHYAE